MVIFYNKLYLGLYYISVSLLKRLIQTGVLVVTSWEKYLKLYKSKMEWYSTYSLVSI